MMTTICIWLNFKNRLDVCCLSMLLVMSVKAQVKITQKSISMVDAKALTIDGKYGQAINGRTYQKDA